ncbi:MAG TPA: sugar phosphate isomerase/epimerase family protein [Candidatus Paceibacterota bacterium]|nr:sugar phosphate isomerase/epimerase family protein [Verrucomicrobiota bacterium]HSA10885.1 sugar phosphate isomerase/epimerase family protein [Candidatus Paceibacterota bacterium]
MKTTGLALSAALLPTADPLLAAGKKKWPVGCRDAHLKAAGMPDSWSCMKALGAKCAEVNVGLDLTCGSLFHPQRNYTLATPDGIQMLKEDLAASGCRISAFMMANRFDERLEEELDCARRLVPAAQQLGVNVIRIDVVPRKLDGDQFLPFAVGACKRLCAIAEDTPIRYGIENHGKITNDPRFLDRLFDGVGSDKLGLTLDCANFYWWGHPVEDLYPIYKQFAPRAFHTHCKSIRYPADKRNVRREMGWEYGKYCCPIYEGDLDFKRIVKILRRANYQGDLCIENESLGRFPENQRADVLRKEIAMLKKLA